MSVTITIKDPRGGHIYTIETPLESVASTKQDVTYEETQQMISEYAARAVNSIVGARPRKADRDHDYYDNARDFYDTQRHERHDRNVRRSPDYGDYQSSHVERRHRDDRSRSPARNDSLRRYLRRRSWSPRGDFTHRRELDSRFVQCATGFEQLTDPESLMVGVGPPGTVEYKFIIKKYTPLRRLVNAYSGLSHIDVKFFELQWRGHRLGWGDGDTAEKYGITNGCELVIVTRPFVRDPALLVEFGPNEDGDPESNPEGESGSEPDIKSESEQSAVARSSLHHTNVVGSLAGKQQSLPEYGKHESSFWDSSESSVDTSSESDEDNDDYTTANESD